MCIYIFINQPWPIPFLFFNPTGLHLQKKQSFHLWLISANRHTNTENIELSELAQRIWYRPPSNQISLKRKEKKTYVGGEVMKVDLAPSSLSTWLQTFHNNFPENMLTLNFVLFRFFCLCIFFLILFIIHSPFFFVFGA